MPFSVGDKLGSYEILAKIGAGGMGEVYRALDTKLGRHVALKFLPSHLSANSDSRTRFLQEARAAAALDHVNVGTVHGIEETPTGQIFIAMAFYPGHPVDELLKERRLAKSEAIALARQIACGLGAAHSQGVVHRDIKPSNVILTRDGVAKIVDFGLARFAGSEHITEIGSTLGTAPYMSPEQARGQEADHRTDIWSLGVVLYEMTTGTLPFRGDNGHSILYKIVHEEPATMPGIPTPLTQVILKALAKDPNARYRSANDLIADLDKAAAGQTVESATVTMAVVPALLPRTWQRHTIWGSSAIAIAIIASAVSVPSWRARAVHWFNPAQENPGLRHIAVLPFRNIGNDPANEALCEGLTEVLTSRLTGLEGSAPSLWVIPSTEVRNKRVSSEEAARDQLGASLAIAGSVQKTAGGVQLALNLVDTKTLRLVGSRVLKSTEGDLAGIEDDAVHNIADLLAVTMNPDAARQTRGASSATPAAYESYLRAKGLLRSSNNPDKVNEALKDFNRAVEQDPRFALAYSGLAEASWAKWVASKDTKYLDTVVENAKRALQLDSQLAPAYVQLAQAHEASRNPELAVDELQRALKLDPRNVDGLRELGRVWERLGRTSDAERMFRQAVDLYPDYRQAHFDYALFLARQGRPKEAEPEYRRVIELAPDSASAYSNLGALLVGMHRTDEAQRMYEKSLNISPSYFAMANLATLLDDRGQTAAAAQKYEEALKLNDKDYRVWASLASEYEDLHDPRARPTLQHATEMAEAALTREPQSPVILSQLAYYYARLDRKSKALELARKADLLGPSDPQILLRTARVFERMGMRDEALHNVETAVQHGAPPTTVSGSTELKKVSEDPRFVAFVARQKNPEQR
jgi:serine/threonine-protein kinase